MNFYQSEQLIWIKYFYAQKVYIHRHFQYCSLVTPSYPYNLVWLIGPIVKNVIFPK